MSFIMSSPFAAISGDQLEDLAESTPELDASNDEYALEGFAGVSMSMYEVEDLDALPAIEKYCRSDLPTQRLTYAAGIGAAVSSLEPSAVSGTLVTLLRELLVDPYADVRHTTLQQVIPVARHLRASGMTYQSDLESLWDIVQPLLLDPDPDNQAAAAAVLAELSHLVAWGNAVAATQKLVWAVQRLQRLKDDAAAEGAMAALRLITEVVSPREGSPLQFASIEDFALSTFRDLVNHQTSDEVRQCVALLLPRFVCHMPTSTSATFLPGVVKALAHDSFWNVRAAVPELLIQLAALPQQQQLQQQGSAADCSTAARREYMAAAAAAAGVFEPAAASSGDQTVRVLQTVHNNVTAMHSHAAKAAAALQQQTAAAAAAEGLTNEEVKTICDVADRLCRDGSHQVRVAAMASLGQLLLLLPATDAAAAKPPLLSLFSSTAKPAAVVSGVKLPRHMCAPRLSRRGTGQRQRQQQQQGRAAAMQVQQQQQHDDNHATVDTAAGESLNAAAAAAAAFGVDEVLLGVNVQQQQQPTAVPTTAAAAASVNSPGTAAAELPLLCALHLGKVAGHVGASCWPALRPSYLSLAASALSGDCDVAAALLLSYPDLAAALGSDHNRSMMVPVVMDLLHRYLERLAPVLSVMLFDVMAALPADKRICLLQLLPSLALQPYRELAGDWRARLSVANQLPAAAALLTSAQVAYCIWPLLLTLGKDPVHAVRAAAAAQMGKVLLLLPDEELGALESMTLPGEMPGSVSEGNEMTQHKSDDENDVTLGPRTADMGDTDVAAAAVEVAALNPDAASVYSDDCDDAGDMYQQQQKQQQQQQQPHVICDVEPRHMFDRVRRGLQQLHEGLQQKVDVVMEHKATQRALTTVDKQLQWLQQQPAGSVLRNIGQRISAAAAAAGTAAVHPPGSSSSSSSSGDAELYSLGPLSDLLVTSSDMLHNTVDPCRYLSTPPWHALAEDLEVFHKGGNGAERQVYVIAASSILNARLQQQQQQQQCDVHLQYIKQQLQQLADDPIPGVRYTVAAAAGNLLYSSSSSSSSSVTPFQKQQLEVSSGDATASAAGAAAAAGSSIEFFRVTGNSSESPGSGSGSCSIGVQASGSSSSGSSSSAMRSISDSSSSGTLSLPEGGSGTSGDTGSSPGAGSGTLSDTISSPIATSPNTSDDTTGSPVVVAEDSVVGRVL